MESLIVCGSVKLTRSSKVGPISIDGCEFGTAACFELRPVDCARSKFFRLEAVQRPALCPSQQNGATSHKNAIKGAGVGG